MVQEIRVVNSAKALAEIAPISVYIAEKGYPETSKKYRDRLLTFGNSLGYNPEKYKICTKPAFRRWNYRCAVFEKTCIFVYKIKNDEVTVLRVIHGKMMK